MKSKHDKIPFTTLTYATGGINNLAYEINPENNKSQRIDPSKSDTTAFNYSQQAAIITDEALHGGGDVPVYAIGLFVIKLLFFLFSLFIDNKYYYFDCFHRSIWTLAALYS